MFFFKSPRTTRYPRVKALALSSLFTDGYASFAFPLTPLNALLLLIYNILYFIFPIIYGRQEGAVGAAPP